MVLSISYVKVVPYPFSVILEQYFDFEHVACVHPQTLGEYVLVENAGTRLIYDQLWPADRRGRRATSRIVQTYTPPGVIDFRFMSGKHQGTEVHSQLEPHANGTRLTETYRIPSLPDWKVLRWLITPLVMRLVNRIWDEDLDVGVCIGGWPGVPDQPSRVESEQWRRSLPDGTYRLGSAEAFPVGAQRVVKLSAGQVLIVRTPDGFRATHTLCPHAGGPLQAHDGDCLRCPWHGARFDMATGAAVAGPTRLPVPVYQVRIVDGTLMLEVRGQTLERSSPLPISSTSV